MIEELCQVCACHHVFCFITSLFLDIFQRKPQIFKHRQAQLYFRRFAIQNNIFSTILYISDI